MQQFILENQWIVLVLVVWVIPWKGIALWKSARSGQKIWFIIFLLINTLAILEIIYIFIVSRKKGITSLSNPDSGLNRNITNNNSTFRKLIN